MNECQVETVNLPPAIGKPEMMQGIRTREAAQNWGRKNGYKKVFWFAKKERVYADKTSRTTGNQEPLSKP